MIQQQAVFPVNTQRLLFAGKELDDERSLADYNIQHDSTIRMVLRNRRQPQQDPQGYYYMSSFRPLCPRCSLYISCYCLHWLVLYLHYIVMHLFHFPSKTYCSLVCSVCFVKLLNCLLPCVTTETPVYQSTLDEEKSPDQPKLDEEENKDVWWNFADMSSSDDDQEKSKSLHCKHKQ